VSCDASALLIESHRPLAPGENALAEIGHDLVFIELHLEPGRATQVKPTLRGQQVVHDAAKQALRAFGRTAPLTPAEGRLRLDILLDRTSIEIFGNGGKMDLRGVFFADPADKSLALGVQGGPARIRRLVAHESKSIWSDSAASP
jgi:sucrose-6-phosphate hydrolase SacC (GH32 family)